MLRTVTKRNIGMASATRMQVGWLLQQAVKEPRHSATAWPWLESAHIVGQSRFVLHGRVHLHMLARALAERRWNEVFAQLIRLGLIPLGHLLRRLPIGNPGSGSVSALTPMQVPEHLHALIVQSHRFVHSTDK